MQNLCSSGAFFFQNGAPSWCKFCAHLVLLFLKMVLLAGAKFVLIGCFFPQNGAPSWCKFCAHLVLLFLKMLLAGAKFVLIWRFFPQNGAPIWCKICAHLAFFLQNGAPSWCKICSCCRSSAVEKENDLGWLKKWCFSGAFFVVKLVQNLCSSGAKCVIIWCFFPSKLFRSCCQERRGLEVDVCVEDVS